MSGGGAGLPIARYLRPEEEVVPFRVRPELDELLSWCGTTEEHAAAQLVTGDGGAGKTRLALQLVQEMAANGWQPLWVPRGLEGEAVTAVRELGTPCVVVVDYAETRDGLGGLLSDAAGDSGGPDLRVVMLARGSGEWWQRLVAGSDEKVARLLTAPTVRLGPITVEGGQNELFREALTVFADKLGVDHPDATLMLTDPEPVVLVVHAAALLAVLDHALGDSGGQPRSTAEVLTGILAHEQRYWARSATARGLDLDVAVQRLAVMAGCLIGADSESTAGELMSRIPDLVDSAERRGKVARWLHDLYPAGRPDATEAREWIGLLRPDPVAEQLVITELGERPELVPRLFTGLNEVRAGRALTMLARAAHAQPSTLNLLRGALAADLEHLAVPALSVAVETNPMLGEVLSETLDVQQLSTGTLERIAATAPYPSFALAAPAAVVLKRLADGSANEDGRRAGWLVDLSNRLGDLGRPEEALAAIEEAAGIHRQLAESHPDAFLPDLAISLTNQSGRLSALGRREEALAAIDQAVTIRRRLVQARPDAFFPDLAISLNGQSNCLAALGRREDALAAIEEAAGIHRQLAEARPDAFLPDLAMSLTNQSGRLSALGRREEALAAIEEAAGVYRQLAEARPDAFLPHLASSLNNQSNTLADLGRHQGALAPMEQAVTIHRQLADARPDAFLPDLAMSLNNLSNRLGALGRHEEALAAIEQAVTIRRQLADARPDAFLPDLATSLNNQCGRLAGLDRHEEALAAIEQAVTIRRQLAEARPDAFLPGLATSLNNQARCLVDLDRHQEALAAIEQAVTIRRQLAEARADVFLPDLANSLDTQALCLASLGRREEAGAASEQAVAIRRQLAESHSARSPDARDISL